MWLESVDLAKAFPCSVISMTNNSITTCIITFTSSTITKLSSFLLLTPANHSLAPGRETWCRWSGCQSLHGEAGPILLTWRYGYHRWSISQPSRLLCLLPGQKKNCHFLTYFFIHVLGTTEIGILFKMGENVRKWQKLLRKWWNSFECVTVRKRFSGLWGFIGGGKSFKNYN